MVEQLDFLAKKKCSGSNRGEGVNQRKSDTRESRENHKLDMA